MLHRWFVQYNPLYFASALCILAGIYLVAHELPPDNFGSKIGVAAATELYQVLLIAGAVVLLRAGLKRPAAILGITAFVFILDVAFNGERLMSFMGLLNLGPGMRARRAIPATLVFALLGPVKLWALARVFRIRGGRDALALCGVILFALPLLPYTIELESTNVSVRQSLYLGLSWLGAPLLGWAFTDGARRWTSGWTEHEPDPWLTRRIALVAPFLVSALYAAHVLGWSSLSDLTLSPAQAAPYLLAAAAAAAAKSAAPFPTPAEFIAWAGTGAALALAAFAPGEMGRWPVAALALAAGAVLVALLETSRLRVFLPAAVCLFGGAWLMSAGRPGPLWPAALAVALLAGAARHRDFRCLFVSSIAAGASIVAIPPAPSLVPYGGILAGAWLAVSCWILFPALRTWVPFAATVAVLALGGWMAWNDVPGISAGYGALAVCTVAAGVAFKRVEFQGAGVGSGTLLAAVHHGTWVPQTPGGWGIALLATGFVLLSAGVAVNLLIARRRPV